MRAPSERSQEQRPATDSDLQIERTRLIFKKLIPTIVLSSAIMIGATILLAHHYDDYVLWRMTLPMLLFSTLRLAVALCYQKRKPVEPTIQGAARWELLYGIATCLYVCPLAVATIYNYTVHDSIAKSIYVIVTFTICNGISAWLGLRPWIANTSGLIMLSGLAIGVLGSKEPILRWSVLLIIFYAYTYYALIHDKFELLVEQLRSKRQMRELAERDALTGLSNRRHFLNCVATVCEQTKSFAIFYLDLDHFKQVNDTCGHQIGDALLQHVADRLRGIVPASDVLARIGGDEFAILHSHIATEGSARKLATHINHAIAVPFAINGNSIKISASVGIGFSVPGQTNADSLISTADHALYRVKLAGGGSFSFAEEESSLLMEAAARGSYQLDRSQRSIP